MTVLHSFSKPGSEDNPFIALTAQSLSTEVEVKYFTWRDALLGRYDVLHLHWLDPFVSGPTKVDTVLHWLGSLMLLMRLRITKTVVVRTLHNTSLRSPSERPVVRLIIRGLEEATSITIVMNRASTVGLRGRCRLVPHGHYRPHYEGVSIPDSRPGWFLNFGLVRAYKGLEALASAFSQLQDPQARLRVVGRVLDREVGRALRAAELADSRVDFVEGHVPDERLAHEIGRSEIVVLPYDDLLNSGCLLLAISLGRPVLVPVCAASEELIMEFGPSWIKTFDHPLTAADLALALGSSADLTKRGMPDLSGRDWSSVAANTVAVYREALASPRG